VLVRGGSTVVPTVNIVRSLARAPTVSREGRGGRLALWLTLLLATQTAHGEPLKNHYNDPFIQVTTGIPACPQPRGPFMTAQDARAEAHPRIERGTTCFRAGKCSEPNSYRYDARIATAAQAAVTRAVQNNPTLGQSSVWLTMQRRFVFVHGCVARQADAARWERLLKSVPEVEYVGVDLAVGKRAKDFKRVPYPVMPR
jgi:hypothetical protein